MLGLIPLYIGGTSTVSKSFYVKNGFVLSVNNSILSDQLVQSIYSENDAEIFKNNISLQVCFLFWLTWLNHLIIIRI